MQGADPTFIKRIVDTGAANVIYLSPGAEELNELPVIRKCVMEYRQNSPVVKKDTLLFVKIFSPSPVWGGNKFNPALHLVQIGFCSSKAETTDTSTRKPFPMIVRNEVPNINSTESGSSQRDMDPRHHKIPYFVVSSGRKGSATAVPYLQKLEKDIFLNKIPSGKGQH
ncbi:hypothetical protein NC653_040875 [Populus alba x Populus x berolinensis]|uniref:Uncharacterized protein n=1 Tax=Populus alba x Populus x berolinensis TaxID=444605 RepID=A0AAD6L752_9ROSI|nr:hypothetical protein NC653_040875 [Populus alba x Populus x berolinensis]